MEERYLLAIMPPDELLSQITKLKKGVAENFGSSHALNAPAHITLHMPFKLSENKVSALHDFIKSVNSEIQPFSILLKDFDFFEPRVVFINIKECQELIALQSKMVRKCQRELKLDNANYKNQAFHPHITIGFRDLKKADFYRAKTYFETREFHEEFEVFKISLLKHNGKTWEVVD